MVKKDIENFDYQTVLVKTDCIDEVVENYACFGWKVVDKNPHTQYENIVEVTFERDHFVKNKDDLQYLQVNYEVDINRRGKLEKFKHLKSTIFSSVLSLVLALCIVSSIMLFLKNLTAIRLAFAIVCTVLSVAISIITPLISCKMLKKERAIFDVEAAKINEVLNAYCTTAKKLLGGKNGK